MKTETRYYYQDRERLSSTLSEQAEAEARWLAMCQARAWAHVGREDRERLIRATAYFRAQRRGFAPGSELEDWLAAEKEVDGAASIRH